MKIKNLYSALGAVGMVALSGIILNGSLMLGGSAFAETAPSEDFEIAVEDDLTTQADEEDGEDDADNDAGADTYTAADFGGDADFFTCVKWSADITGTDITSISKSDVAAIESLSCSGKDFDIKTIAGLNLMPNLTSFNLANQNNLTSVDLSKNNKISNLTIHDNAKLATIKLGTMLDLKGIYIYNNAVTELDLSGATELTSINLRNNKLSKVDLTKNTKATAIVLSNNELASIDISQNKALINFYAYGNKLEYLDASKINTNLLGLYLDDNVLVRTNFVAAQNSKNAVYYAASSTNGGTNGMFIPMIVATGLSQGETEITTKGATFYGAVGTGTSNKCAGGDAFCIVFDANILNYQDYVQLKYVGEAASEVNIDAGMDNTKRNYRLEINLEAWKEQAEGGDIKVPDTGASTGSANAVIIAASLGALALVSGGAYLAVYTAKRAGHKVSFKK